MENSHPVLHEHNKSMIHRFSSNDLMLFSKKNFQIIAIVIQSNIGNNVPLFSFKEETPKRSKAKHRYDKVSKLLILH